MLDTMSKSSERLIIPTPALAETLCFASNPGQVSRKLGEFACIEIVGFDEISSIEFAELIQHSKPELRQTAADASRPWQHLKMDLQIVSIAKAHGAGRVITDDGPQANFATFAGLSVERTWDLPLLDQYSQRSIFDDDEE